MTWSDISTPVTATYTRNGVGQGAYSSGTSLTTEGKYVVTATDAAGNSSSTTFYVDKTVPTLTRSAEYSKTGINVTWSVGTYESPVTATYTLNGASKGTYTSGTSLTTEGKYVVTATDAAGNSSSSTFYVDKTAPTLTRSAEYSNSGIKVTWGVGTNESPITATYTLNGASKGAYTSGTSLTTEGKYVVTATDAAGNSSSSTFYVDKTAPTLTRSAEYSKTSITVRWSVGTNESPVTATYTLNGASMGSYTSGTSLTTEGKYVVTATDAAGNSSSSTFYVDRTAPTLQFYENGSIFAQYTREAFSAVGDDNNSGVAKLEILSNGSWSNYSSATISENGEYTFRVTDNAGNTSTSSAVLYRTDTFGNRAAIADGYKLNEWYIVTLPARIFTTANRDIAGRYSFATYSEALNFAAESERAFRVTEVQGGYMYISAANETVAQKYTDFDTLDVVLRKYAAAYISERKTAVETGKDSYYSEPMSLTRNTPELPAFLSDYKDFPRYFMQSSVTWSLPSLSFIRGMPYSVTTQYLGDFQFVSSSAITIPSGSTLKAALDNSDSYRQGFYLITETDACGNVEQYLVYSDAELPTAIVSAEYGDGTEPLELDYTFVNNNTLYFISLSFSALLDNADGYITLKIAKGNASYYFTQSDELPVLCNEDYGSGMYTVTIFDRSLNMLTFDVYIAGNAPTWSHSSLAADRADCTVTFTCSDRYNVLTSISLYKIEYDGAYTRLDVDGNGVPVSTATLSYTLTVGGKYTATITDNYRRTLELNAIFFLKGLPSGSLSGVSDGGRTNKNVSFTFDPGDACEIYILLPGGERRTFSDYSVQNGSSSTVYNITASEDTSYEYLVFLYSSGDRSLYVEYTFEIDCVLPTFYILNSDGDEIQPDGATNKAFYLRWDETDVTVRYYTAKNGSLSSSRYTMNAVLTSGTLYYFTIKDSVGNTLEFTVLLDNYVDYSISGNYNSVGGVLYAKTALTFTVNEPTQEFSVANDDGYTVVNGGAITQAGHYVITVTDNYKNTLELVIVVDFTAPTLELDGVSAGGSTRGSVTVTADNYDYLHIVDSRGNVLRALESGAIFTESGTYYIAASDYAGNTATVMFVIDLGVDYELSVPSGAVTTGKVTLTQGEKLDVYATLNGTPFSGYAYSEPGMYELTLTDAIGNSVTVRFVIIAARVQTFSLDLPTGTIAIGALKDELAYGLTDSSSLVFSESGAYVVTLDCGGITHAFTVTVDNTPPSVELKKEKNTVKIVSVDKSAYTLTLTKDGQSVDCRVGQTLSDYGKYVLTVIDDLGNVITYEFEIKYRLNTWAIVAILVGAVALLVVLILIFRARRRPRVV